MSLPRPGSGVAGVRPPGAQPVQCRPALRVSAVDLGYPHDLLASDHIRAVTAGDLKIQTRR
jgi:hypothetical protein